MGLTTNDYKALLAQMLPRGIAWQGPNLQALAQAFAAEFERVDAQGETLLSESFPQTADQCLADWERIAGLPDAAFPVSVDVGQRRANLVAKLSAQGGQSRAYLIAVAARLGYTVSSITDRYAPFAAGVGYAGAPIYDEWWAFTFTVHVTGLPGTEVVTYNPAAPPLRQYANARLEAAISALKPAHTTALYTYP